MGKYPELPDNRLIVNNVDLTETYRIILLDGYTLEPPSPKTYTVDIPGGNGVIDLTEALTGDVAYENRNQEFTFALIYPEDFEAVKTKLSNFLHGQSYDYKMTMDPEYTYHGRFTVSSYEHAMCANGILGQIKINIDANPYKTKESKTYKLNATGGKMYRFESGRCKVRPIIECEQTCFVSWNGKEITVSPGTYRLNDVIFSRGFNEFYVNSHRLYFMDWDGLAAKRQTWDDMKEERWDELQLLNSGYPDAPRSWDELYDKTWDDLAEKHWYELNYAQNNIPENYVYISYEWKDL